ncbi:uncharacterized protein [Triticum aestivum]|uniref:uncharacterized protein n=1 Tax=Triticum aestivum TaxID=4565 RepID=UPI001D019437|nr:uncharacterized protein LOC123065184 [Triticum aestivum]
MGASMPCEACGCACSAGGEASKEELESPLLTDIETGPGHTTTPPDAKTGRIATFIFRVLLVFLWVYLFDSMRRYAIKYTEGDTKFSLFAVILMALPMTDPFLIIGG